EEVVSGAAKGEQEGGEGHAATFLVPADAPTFLRDAVERARAASKPMLVDFWAPWCAPCLRLKRETLESDRLAPVLKEFEVVVVDLDQAPALGGFYGVSSVPCVILVDAQGTVLARVLGYAPPSEFERQLRKVLR